MKRIIITLAFLVCLKLLLACFESTGKAAVLDKPNLIVIMADDLGYAEY